MMILPGIEQAKIASTSDKTEAEHDTQGRISDTFSRQVQAAQSARGESKDSALAWLKGTGGDIAEKGDRLKRLSGQQDKGAIADSQATATLLASQLVDSHATNKARPDGQPDTDEPASDLQAISALLGMLPAPQQPDSPATSAAGPEGLHPKAPGMNLSRLPGALTSSPADSGSSASADITREAAPLSLIKDSADLRLTGHSSESAASQPSGQPVIQASLLTAANSAASAPVSAPLNAPLGSQAWQQQLSQQVTLFTRQGIQQAELRLHPEHLGKVDISLKFDDNQLQLLIMSPHSHVRAALEAALPILRTSLSESGVQLGQSQVAEENLAQQHAGEHGDDPSSRTPYSAFETDKEETILPATSTTLQRLADRRGAVDIFA